MTMQLLKVVQTCRFCPSQWDAWTTGGQYLYLRYRFGVGTVEAQPSPDTATWERDGELIAKFGEESMDGTISLDEFLERAGLLLADGADVS